MSAIGDTEYRDTNVEIKFSAHDVFQEDIYQAKIFESQQI